MHFLYVGFIVVLCALACFCSLLWKKIVALKCELQKAKTIANARGVFVNITAHDFRNHLTKIKMSADMIEYNKDNISSEIMNIITKNITCGVQKLTTMIEDMMLLGKLQYNQVVFSPKIVNVLQLCHEIAIEYDKNLSRTELSVVGKIPNESNIDCTLFRHILSNLLSNALKYSTSNVLLELSIDDKFLMLKVVDHGIGIPENELESIGNIFERCANAKRISGSGIGMYIVSQCVNLHNGQMYIKSELNRGTTVIIKIPFKRIE